MQPTLTEHVANGVRAELARRRLRQKDLARALGISDATMTRRLAGDQPFTIPELEIAARFLGVPLSSLVTSAA